MGMFGIPLSGADICGFLGNTNEALCTKWHYVGAFYPFSRNHNGGSLPQEPYVFSKPAMAAMTNAIKLKYSMIRYYYTELFILSLRGQGTFFKPLFFEFPEDDEASMIDIEYNVMLGSALKLSINSGSISEKTTEYYFPAGWWCKLSGNTGNENCFKSPAGGTTKTYASGLTDYQLHLREGYIVPMQDATNKNFTTSVDLQQMPVDLHVAGSPSEEGDGTWFSQGRYVNDDGLSLNIVNNYNSYSFYAQYDGSKQITMRVGMDA
jgi:alpha-glucosidase (family GH31 glycosyl hydrolase)